MGFFVINIGFIKSYIVIDWDVTEESTVTESTEITEETTDWSTDSSTKFPDWPPLTDNATHPDVEITTPQNDIVPEKKPRPHDYQWMVLAVVFIVLTLGTSSAAIFVLLITPSGALALK
ncbi:hypothetical protein DMENIID0001_152710 [Sergentomyia squamirostris]